jgi:single-stranded DNA-binding protein
MTPTSPNQPKRFNLYGNLGADPEPHSVPAKQLIKTVYDEVTDGPIEKVIDLKERNFLTFSVATGGYDDVPLRWINCIDWEGCAFRARRGDKVELYGYFEDRTYTTRDGEQKTVRQYVVENCQIKFMKCRELE